MLILSRLYYHNTLLESKKIIEVHCWIDFLSIMFFQVNKGDKDDEAVDDWDDITEPLDDTFGSEESEESRHLVKIEKVRPPKC